MTDYARKTLFGRPACRFRGRYDKRTLPIFTETADPNIHVFNGLDKYETVYVRDVCIKCGKTIERSKS